jgi:peptidoglycan/LPS O-acetylase OafA/YrhL
VTVDLARVDSPRRGAYVANLDGLRAIAAGAVVITHVSSFATGPESFARPLLNHLGVGVVVFFVLSGYLLYRPFAAAHLAGGPMPGVRRYATRRVLRIVPAYWLALTALAVYPGLVGVFTDHWWRYYGFGQIYSADYTYTGIAPAWTLCIEVTFYALLPLFAWFVRARSGSRTPAQRFRRELWLLAAGFAAYLGWRVIQHFLNAQLSADAPWINVTLLGTFDWFILGMLLAVLAVRGEVSPPLRRTLRRISSAALACWAIAFALLCLDSYVISRPHASTWEHFIFGAFALLIVAPIAFGGDGLAHRVLRTRPMVYLGLISYGIYLWHYPLLKWLDDIGVGGGESPGDTLVLGVVGSALTVLMASVSFILVERPLLRWGKARATRRAQQPSPVAADPTAAGGVVS